MDRASYGINFWISAPMERARWTTVRRIASAFRAKITIQGLRVIIAITECIPVTLPLSVMTHLSINVLACVIGVSCRTTLLAGAAFGGVTAVTPMNLKFIRRPGIASSSVTASAAKMAPRIDADHPLKSLGE
jgi:hypothetical protein